jgi:hypothetical protein
MCLSLYLYHKMCDNLLEGQCHEIFDFKFFHESVSPQAPAYPIRAVLNFFRKFSEIFAAQGAPTLDTGGKWKNLPSEKF